MTMRKKYTMVEKEVITIEKTREYTLSENDEENTAPRNFAYVLLKYFILCMKTFMPKNLKE